MSFFLLDIEIAFITQANYINRDRDYIHVT